LFDRVYPFFNIHSERSCDPINPRNDSLENLLMRVRHFATTLFEAKGIDYTIDIQQHVDEVRLPIEYRQHIYLILKEAINNLVKYAQAI
jgi:signal transduction histidine kinase